MQIWGGGYNPLSGGFAQSTTLYEQVQQLRQADARLRADAARIQARAEASGEAVATQVNFTRGPDGRNYAASITITRTRSQTITLGGEQAQQRTQNNSQQPLAQSMDDISPVRFPFTPDELVQGFAQRSRQTAQDIAEAAALDELQRVDSGVRVHEGLHFRAAGGIAQGIAELEYIEGPDGQYYAVAGNVNVQTSTTSDPEKAKREANAFAAAASAPADASAQDNMVARGAFSRAADTYGRAFDARNPPVAEYDLVA